MQELRRKVLDFFRWPTPLNRLSIKGSGKESSRPASFFEEVPLPENLKKTYCPLPFIHLSVGPNEAMRVCCNSGNYGDLKNSKNERYYFGEVSSVKDFVNKSSLSEVRRSMLNGERPKECTLCYIHEDAGGYSIRQSYVVGYSHLIQEHIEQTSSEGEIDPKIQYVDFALGNNCNIKCRMCNPTNSKLMHKEFVEIFKNDMPNYFSPEEYEKASLAWTNQPHYEKILKEISPTVDRVLMTGGEPFVIKAQYDILDKLIESGRSDQIELYYHTNLTVLPGHLIDRWKRFKKIFVHGSIDGVGPVNDFVRAPARWSAVDKNLRKLIELRKEINLHIEVHTVFQAYTILRIPELLEYLLQFRKEIVCFPFFNYLHNPPHLKVNVLPRSIRAKGVAEIRKFLDKNRILILENVEQHHRNLRHLKVLEGHLNLTLELDEEFNYPLFLEFNSNMDKVRKENMVNVLPELFPTTH